MSKDDLLSADEGRAWVGFLRVHAQVVRELDRAMQRQQGLSLAEFEVLLYLSVVPTYRRRLSALTAHSLLSLSGMSRLVDRLERIGLVTREASPEDKRGIYVVLSPLGVERLRQADQAHQRDIHAQFTRHFTVAELDQMAAFWERVRPDATAIIEPLAE